MAFTPSPISALALTQRQLADWQQFHADLMLQKLDGDNSEELDNSIAYAYAQTERLQKEVELLTSNGDSK